MNIAFFLTPKSEVVYVTTDATMRQVLEKMEYHTFTAIPLINNNGKYIGAITEGDLLWKLKNSPELTIEGTSKVSIKDVKRHTKSNTVSINSTIIDLVNLVKTQNFVPVVDDEGIFIGIIRRSVIINYCTKVFINNEG